jgi:hypothetical protein
MNLEANNLLLLAKLHRREKNVSVAADALIQAEALGSLYCRLEEAKLLYDNKEVCRALSGPKFHWFTCR